MLGLALATAAVIRAGGWSSGSPGPVPLGPMPVLTPAGKPSGMLVGHSYKNDVSPLIRHLPAGPLTAPREREPNANPSLDTPHRDSADPVLQRTAAAPKMPSPSHNFEGISYPGVNCDCMPPDTNGEAGLTQYVQMVNTGFEVFDKSDGTSLYGPAAISTLWAGFGGLCQDQDQGDPIVVYDQLTDRWVISQFAGDPTVTDECIAVSTTSDATGSYYRYGFHLGSEFFDYPKIGVWPDAYYMSMNVFSGNTYDGPQPFAFDRAAMTAGDPATFITKGITGGSTEAGYLPADLDGKRLPPDGAPDPFVEWPGAGEYKVFRFHVDWENPGASTFSAASSSPSAAAFVRLCPSTADCVPQKDTSQGLDAIGDRLMFRAAYRNFGDHESLVTNYAVDAGSGPSQAGVRWLELRGVTTGTPILQQESTYAPADGVWRWMGSAAMDHVGDLAVGFSSSSDTSFPDIRYAGRLVSDTPGELAQGEATLVSGAGSQTESVQHRWGDYSDLVPDPADDCTLWYTTEYYTATSDASWHTRIGAFKFPSCSVAEPLLALTKSADSRVVAAGSQIGFTLPRQPTRAGRCPVRPGASIWSSARRRLRAARPRRCTS